MNRVSDEVTPRELTVAEWIRFQLLNDLPLDFEVPRQYVGDVTTFARQGTY